MILACNVTKPGIMKIILYGVLEGSNGEPLLVLIYVNDLDSNTINPMGIKATFFAMKLPFQSQLEIQRMQFSI
jgi:hypothetical protein